MHPLEKVTPSGVESFDQVGAEVTGRTGTALAIAMPEIKGRGAVAQRGEPVSGVDHLVGVGRPARVLVCEAEARIASELARTIADAGGVAGLALIR